MNTKSNPKKDSQSIKPDPASDISYGKCANPPKKGEVAQVPADELAKAIAKANENQRIEEGKTS